MVLMGKRTLSARLQHARSVRGFKASELDHKAGLTRGHTWQIENGRKPKIEVETAQKLAAALGVSLDWLVNGKGEGPAARPSSPPPSRAA